MGKNGLFSNALKSFYYICVIKFQNNGSDMKYIFKIVSNPTLSVPKEPALEAGKTALPMVQKVILDAKVKEFFGREEIV